MSIIDQLADKRQWLDYYEYKVAGGNLTREDQKALLDFIEAEGYMAPLAAIRSGAGFAPPRKSSISKMSTGKKRIVYTYSDAENRVLKLLTYLLQRKYDYMFADNLYSFRPHRGVRDAIRTLTRAKGIRRMWSYKVDISNYFNSAKVDRMIALLRRTMTDEPEALAFLESLLTNPLVNDHGKLIPEEKGIMAGTPISTFLANLYLAHLDMAFAGEKDLYARYSDDIIVFNASKEQLERDIAFIRDALTSTGLTINPAKEQRTAPGQMWTFLGICYRDGVIDVAPVSVQKLKAKMRRKTRALMRWKDKKGVPNICAAKAFVRVFQRKLFENPVANELTWTRWYFPLINTADSLREIDAYSQQCIRYLATGTHTKAAYNFRYEDIKALGYNSLVNAYYKKETSGED